MNRESIIEFIRDTWETMPDLSFAEMLDTVLPAPIYDYEDEELEEAFKQVLLQNM